RFMREMAKLELELSELRTLGPVAAQRWKFSDPALPWPITAELWRRDDGALILEASIKAPISQAAVAAGGFLAHLAEIGAERDHAQEAKTRWALEHYAGKARGRVRQAIARRRKPVSVRVVRVAPVAKAVKSPTRISPAGRPTTPGAPVTH